MKCTAIALVALFCMSAWLSVAMDAQADTYYYRTWAPSANESDSWKIYPRYTTGHTSCYAAQVFEDGYTQNLASSTGSYYYIETGDFTNDNWLGPWDDEFNQTGDMPYENATILSVNVLAKFNSQYPATILYFSINDGASYTASSSYAAGGGGMSPYYSISWNVTSLIAWNSTILSSPDTWVKAKFSPVTGINYYLDYLGFWVGWTDETPGGELIPGEAPETGEGGMDLDWDFMYTGEGLIGLMGFISFILMIATPALGFVAYRSNPDEGKIMMFIKMLVLFMLCITMFMYSISVA